MPEPVIRPRKPGGSVPNVTRSMYSYASHHSVPNPMTRTWDSGASRVPANAAVGGSPSRNPGRTTAHFDATRSREVSRSIPSPSLPSPPSASYLVDLVLTCVLAPLRWAGNHASPGDVRGVCGVVHYCLGFHFRRPFPSTTNKRERRKQAMGGVVWGETAYSDRVH